MCRKARPASAGLRPPFGEWWSSFATHPSTDEVGIALLPLSQIKNEGIGMLVAKKDDPNGEHPASWLRRIYTAINGGWDRTSALRLALFCKRIMEIG